MHFKPDFPSDPFEGTAIYYSRFRIPYPQILLDDLIQRTTSPANSKLLDLATGPGRIAIRLAPWFSKVLANDISSEMIDVGKSEASLNNINNIDWLPGKAEDLNLESNSIDLITIGEAFHRLDENAITELSFGWLKPGGFIAFLGCYGILNGEELWQKTIKDIVQRWTSFSSSNTKNGPEHCRQVLKDKGFIECNSYNFISPHYWTIESIIGNLYSTSFCSIKALGNNKDKFETEIKEALEKLDKSGIFFENIRCGYTLGRKPV